MYKSWEGKGGIDIWKQFYIIFVPKVRQLSKTNGAPSKVYKSQHEGTPTGQRWGNMSIRE